MSVSFNAHGRSQISVKHNLIIVKAYGPWNLEFFNQLHQQLIAARAQVDINNYGILVDFIGEAMIVEEAKQSHINFVKQGHAKAIALSLADCSTAIITQDIFAEIYQAGGLKYQFFDSLIEAKNWLCSQLDPFE